MHEKDISAENVALFVTSVVSFYGATGQNMEAQFTTSQSSFLTK